MLKKRQKDGLKASTMSWTVKNGAYGDMAIVPQETRNFQYDRLSKKRCLWKYDYCFCTAECLC